MIASDRAVKVQQRRPALKMNYQALPETLVVDHRKNQGRAVSLLPSVAWVVQASVEAPGEYLECLWYLVSLVALGHLQIGRAEALLWVVKLVVDWKLKKDAGFALLLPSPEQCSRAVRYCEHWQRVKTHGYTYHIVISTCIQSRRVRYWPVHDPSLRLIFCSNEIFNLAVRRHMSGS